MRQINCIVVHTTATERITRVWPFFKYWIETLGWKREGGYHKVIFPSGEISTLAEDQHIVNGCPDYNRNGLHIATIGGLKKDDRTPEQKESVMRQIKAWQSEYGIPDERVFPHYELDPRKSCPWYDPRKELKVWQPKEDSPSEVNILPTVEDAMKIFRNAGNELINLSKGVTNDRK